MTLIKSHSLLQGNQTDSRWEGRTDGITRLMRDELNFSSVTTGARDNLTQIQMVRLLTLLSAGGGEGR